MLSSIWFVTSVMIVPNLNIRLCYVYPLECLLSVLNNVYRLQEINNTNVCVDDCKFVNVLTELL